MRTDHLYRIVDRSIIGIGIETDHPVRRASFGAGKAYTANNAEFCFGVMRPAAGIGAAYGLFRSPGPKKNIFGIRSNWSGLTLNFRTMTGSLRF